MVVLGLLTTISILGLSPVIYLVQSLDPDTSYVDVASSVSYDLTAEKGSLGF